VYCGHCNACKYDSTTLIENICSIWCKNLYWPKDKKINYENDNNIYVMFCIDKDGCNNCGKYDFPVLRFNGKRINNVDIGSDDSKSEDSESEELNYSDKLIKYISEKNKHKKNFNYGYCELCHVNGVRYAFEIENDVSCKKCGHTVVMRSKFFKNVCSTQCDNAKWIHIKYLSRQMEKICRFKGKFKNLKCSRCDNIEFDPVVFTGENLYLSYNL
jgi:hypothetical protein